ncbi:hypothetical protein LXL04_009651 [Taraxacum kok-saghyz]
MSAKIEIGDFFFRRGRVITTRNVIFVFRWCFSVFRRGRKDDGDPAENASHTEKNHELNSISTFKSMLEVEEENNNNWFLQQQGNLLLHPVDSSSSCLLSSAFQNHFFLPLKPSISSILNPNPLDETFDLGCGNGFLGMSRGFCRRSNNGCHRIKMPINRSSSCRHLRASNHSMEQRKAPNLRAWTRRRR